MPSGSLALGRLAFCPSQSRARLHSLTSLTGLTSLSDPRGTARADLLPLSTMIIVNA